ncbi:acyl-CoA thioesterase II [Colletotrichum graminicola]|uniref:Acyl-CoA thioesterase II n=1 Tax=Colletotrichum graminicola (strain M1.001 / M2 / FGSC 10212) TaxID=645133 RepID=E3QZ24_COLGM|nr:acyl-CoA thioesterase II [Colletotrichum graminicola M1.001]EFQ36112.1 acyl-CoA thioesterase II [Colletotrichum graminicola M1.001]WDK14879.1 acyl-CoA thioesterase II [Colletotrichum graminicola]
MPKLLFHDVLALAPLATSPNHTTSTGSAVKRYMSLYPAWIPGSELVGGQSRGSKADPRPAYGGHVYCQAALAASRAVKEEEPTESRGDFGLHTIQGVFSAATRSDRPLVYEVSALSTSRTFCSKLVTARQPQAMSSRKEHDDNFLLQDAEDELGNVCFTCICTFKRPEEGRIDSQEEPPQKRFADILATKSPRDWPHAPAVDVEEIKTMFPAVGETTFPVVDMHKVDLTAYNEGKPSTQRKELILYRLKGPLTAKDPNSHIAVHAFESDRNGLLMIGNHNGLGWNLGTAVSLTYKFVVHVNADQAVMKDPSGPDDGWWIQEASFPRVGQGRGALMCKIWSPEGIHVATGYQDGIVRERRAEGLKIIEKL